MSPRARLFQLLRTLRPAEIRRLVVYGADRGDLEAGIHWEASAEDVADEVVTRLGRDGLDVGFYRALLGALPGQGDEVRALAAEAGVELDEPRRPEPPKPPKPPRATLEGAWQSGTTAVAMVWTGLIYVYVEFLPDGFPAAIARGVPTADGVELAGETVTAGPFQLRLSGSADQLQGQLPAAMGGTMVAYQRVADPRIDAWRARHAALLTGDAAGFFSRPVTDLGLLGPIVPANPTGRWLCQTMLGGFALVFGPAGWQQYNAMGGMFGGGIFHVVGPFVKLQGQSEGFPTQGYLYVQGFAAQGQLLARGQMVPVTAQRG